MTVRTVRIISSEEKGPSISCGEYVDTTPDRECFEIEGIDCTVPEFMEWFLETEDGEDFCQSGNTLIDIGGTLLDMSPGKQLSVSFEQYIAGWRLRRRQAIVNQIRIDTMRAYESLGIEHWFGEALSIMVPDKRLHTALHMHRLNALSQDRLDEITNDCRQHKQAVPYEPNEALMSIDELHDLLADISETI